MSKRTLVIDHDEPKKKRKVMEEDAYLASLNAIIQRDFFPDLPKLKRQVEMFEAARVGDVLRLQELQKESEEDGESGTSAPFETPSGRVIDVRFRKDTNEFIDSEGNSMKANLGLDSFLSKFTSEDNASFSEIMAFEQTQLKKRYPWLYHPEDCQKALEDKSGEQQQQKIQYEARNSLMYVPDGVALSASESVESAKGPPKEVSSSNSRFPAGYSEAQKREILNREASQQQQKKEMNESAPQLVNQMRARREGPKSYSLNGTEEEDSNASSQYSYLYTPSPAPGEQFTPLMTWGAIEGTPLLLGSAGDTPAHLSSTTPSRFKVAETPAREKVGHQLVEQSKQKNSSKSRGYPPSLLTPGSRRSATTPFATPRTKTTASKLSALSPAARKILASSQTTKPSHLDSQLRASYSTTPKPITPSMMKPITPSYQRRTSSSREVPSSSSVHVGNSQTTPLVQTKSTPIISEEKSRPSRPSSVTDDLLNL